MPEKGISELSTRAAISALQEEKEWSTRELSRQLQALYPGWGSPALISNYRTGKLPISKTAMERIARAFQVRPETFAEYRLAVARAQLDPDQVGLQIALKNLERFDR